MLSRFKNTTHQIIRSDGFLLIFILLYPLSSLGQAAKKDNELSRDERGKYIHYEVVEKSLVSPDSLYHRANAFLKTKKIKEIKQVNEQLSAKGKMIINKTAFVLAHPSGEILYSFIFEARAGKYRFWLTDFVFIPYQRDRYGNFVPSTVKGMPLEDNPGKLNSGEWSSYLTAASNQSAALAAEFKDYLSAEQKTKAPASRNSISTKNW